MLFYYPGYSAEQLPHSLSGCMQAKPSEFCTLASGIQHHKPQPEIKHQINLLVNRKANSHIQKSYNAK